MCQLYIIYTFCIIIGEHNEQSLETKTGSLDSFLKLLISFELIFFLLLREYRVIDNTIKSKIYF
jgi:hypothetical protein